MHKNQSGVSLLMAVLILASITAISFSIANIVFIEIRSSGDFVRSERALYAAYAITEESLFKYSRGVDFEYLNGAESYNGVYLSAEADQESQSPFIDTVSPTNPKQYDLVDVNNPNGPGGYKRIQLVYRTIADPSPSVRYKLWMFDPAAFNPKVLVTEGTLNSYGNSFEDANLDIALQYQLTLENEGVGDATVAIYTYGPTVSAVKGLPNLGQTFVDITASYLGLTRRYETTIPYSVGGGAGELSFRYLRIRTPASNSWVAWGEVESYDENDNLVSVVSASASSTNPPNPVTFAYDGDLSNWWSAGASNGTITFDYGSVKTFSRVRMYPRSTPDPATTTHYVEISSDGSSYSSLTSFGTSIPSSVWLTYP